MFSVFIISSRGAFTHSQQSHDKNYFLKYKSKLELYSHTVMSATDLQTLGYVVFPVFDADEMKSISQEFVRISMNAPELQPHATPKRLVMGAVGYVPLASMVYHPFFRKINERVYEKAKQLFTTLAKGENTLFSMLPDRLLMRFPDQKVDEKGKWHQDDAANATENDECYGGWVNLNHDETQYFKCLPGTHKPHHELFEKLEQKDGGRRGYANFRSKDDYELLENFWKTEGKRLVDIPPGHVLVFRETLIHTVFKNPPTDNYILRQHVSFLLSDHPSAVPLHDRPTNKKFAKRPKLIKYFKDQAIVPVRSGQETPVYSPFNLFPGSKRALEDLSSHYIEACKKDGLVKRFLPSMKELENASGVAMHDPMTEDEIALYLPRKLARIE